MVSVLDSTSGLYPEYNIYTASAGYVIRFKTCNVIITYNLFHSITLAWVSRIPWALLLQNDKYLMLIAIISEVETISVWLPDI